MKNNKKIGYALGGGGARGVAHIGVLRVLEKEGIRPDYITGSSFGAAIAAAYALGTSVDDLEKEVLGKKKLDIFRMLDLAHPRKALFRGRKIKHYLNEIIGEKDFADTNIPLTIITTDLSTGEEVIIEKGNIVEAIRASIAVPGIFPPININDRYLIDGGVANPTPVDVAKKMGADFVIGVDLILKRNTELKDPKMVSTLMQAYEIIRSQVIKYKLQEVKDYSVVLRPEVTGTMDGFKFTDMAKFIEIGERAAEDRLEEIKKFIE